MNASPQTLLPFASPELGWDEILANGRRALDAYGELRTQYPAHLPPVADLPRIYALCPGCPEHPSGGIFPAVELVRSRACPAGRRLRGGAAGTLFEEKEDPAAEREGSAGAVLKRRDPTLPSSLLDSVADDRLRSGPFPRNESLTPGSTPETGPRFALTRPWGLCSRWLETQRLRLARAWYFRRRAAVCRRRLSRIASAASSIS